ncbi:hypothetical protein STVA_15440 [Allostella vacuolata]|nr:hypothetical protein STVA_15440 [Stella vacuolata]
MPIPLIAWAAAAAVLAATGGAWRYFFGSATVPAECRDKLRIWVVGPTGVGKTTLIRAVLGRPVAPAAAGPLRTVRLAWHWEERLPLALADTVGLELVRGAGQVSELASRLRRTPAAARPHAAWICVRDGADRLFGADPATADGTEAALARALIAQGIPCIGVLTQSEADEEVPGGMAEAMRTAIPGLAAIVPVCVIPRLATDGAELVPRHGLDRLRAATLAAVEPAPLPGLATGWPAYGW